MFDLQRCIGAVEVIDGFSKVERSAFPSHFVDESFLPYLVESFGGIKGDSANSIHGIIACCICTFLLFKPCVFFKPYKLCCVLNCNCAYSVVMC